MATPASLRPPPKAPELGAFPLDHLRECRPEIRAYYTCLEASEYLAPKCRDQVRAYLQCRMEKGLMVHQDISKFGLPETVFVPNRHLQNASSLEQKMTGASSVPVVVDAKYSIIIDDGYEVSKKGEN